MAPEELFGQLILWIVNLCPKFYTFCLNFILYSIYMFRSGSVLGIRIRIHKSPENGSNTDPDPQHWAVPIWTTLLFRCVRFLPSLQKWLCWKPAEYRTHFIWNWGEWLKFLNFKSYLRQQSIIIFLMWPKSTEVFNCLMSRWILWILLTTKARWWLSYWTHFIIFVIKRISEKVLSVYLLVCLFIHILFFSRLE